MTLVDQNFPVATSKALPWATELHALYRESFPVAPVEQMWTTMPRDEYRQMVADRYEHTPDEMDRTAVHLCYAAFEAEIAHQFHWLMEQGVKFDFTFDDPVDPETGKPSYCYLRKLADAGPIPIYRTNEGEHALLANRAQWMYHNPDGQVVMLTSNCLFRAVHDFLAHLAGGWSMGERGEIKAYQWHRVLLSEWARRALFVETVAQNAYYQVHGDFAPQKVMLLPHEWSAPPV